MKKSAWVLSLCASLTAFAAVADSHQPVEILNFSQNDTYPFSSAARVGNLLFMSGQLGVVPGQNGLVPGASRPRPGKSWPISSARPKPAAFR